MIRILSPSQFEKVYKTKKKGSTSTDVTAPPYTLVPFRARPAALVVFSPSPLPSGPKPRRRRLPFSNCQPPPRLCLVKPVVMPSAEAESTRHSSPPPSSSHSPPRSRGDVAHVQPRFPLPHAPAGRRVRVRRSVGEMLRSAVPAPRPRPRAPPPGRVVIGRAGGSRSRASRADPPLTLRQLRVQDHLHGTRALLLGES